MNSMKAVTSFIVTLFSLLLLTPNASAQSPIDSLRSPKQDLKGYSYTLGIEYTPDGAEGAGLDEKGPYLYARQTSSLIFSGTFVYNPNDALSLSARASSGFNSSRIKRTYATDVSRLDIRQDLPLQPSVGVTYRFFRENSYAPALSVAVRKRGPLQVGFSLNHVRDPTVLSASIGYTWQGADPGDLLISLSSGFVANERVNFSLQASHGIPQYEVQPAWTTVGFRVGYALDDTGSREVATGLSLSVRGEKALLGFNVTFAGRGP